MLPDVAAVAVVVFELLIEKDCGCVGGTARAMLALPASLSLLSLGEGDVESIPLKRRKTPLLLLTTELVAVLVASCNGRLLLGEVSRRDNLCFRGCAGLGF